MKKSKGRFIVVLFALVAAVTCMFAFVGCKDRGGSGTSNVDGDNSGVIPAATKYTVTYDANGGVFADGSDIFTQSVEENSTLTTPASPTRQGRTFAGWAKKKSGKDMWQFSEDKVTEDITLYATWNEKSATVLSVDGASIDGNEIFMLVDHTTDSVSLSNKVVCSSDSVWRLYYDRLGQTEIPTKMAAGLSGALADGNNVFYIVVTSQDATQTNLYELVVHRSYAVNVNYYDGARLLKSEQIYTGDTFNVNYTPDITGYTFNEWKDGGGAKAQSQFTVWQSTNLYADKTAKTYTVSLNVNGGNELTDTEKTVTYDDAFTLAKPAKTGYSFLGWYSGNDAITDSDGKSLAAWQFAQNKSLSAKWKANDYTLTVKSNLAAGGSVTGGGDYAYDSTVQLTASTNGGYTFLGWYDSSDELVSMNLTHSVKMGFATTYTAKWVRCPVSIESSNTSVGSVSGLPRATVAGETYTLTATGNKLGYNYLGWYNGNNMITTQFTYTFTMPSSGSVTYTAKWLLDDKMTNIEFTSTATTCKITGVSDKAVTEITVPDYVTSIESDAFCKCSSLMSITIGNSVTSIGRGAFYKCSSLMSIAIPDSVTSIGQYAFEDCSSLTSITIPFMGASKYGTSNTHFGYIFGAGSYSDNAKYIPESLKTVIITGGKSIGSGAFNGCSSLTSITIPDSVTSIGDYAFYDCSSLTSITIPNSVTSIGSSAFYGCSSLTSITIPQSVTSIGWYAFHGCSSLTSITIPNSVTSIWDWTFGGCSSLTSITIPQSVTIIGSDAFWYCSNLTSITIPNSVTSIGDWAFDGCSKLTSVYYKGTAEDWAKISIGGSNSQLTNATRHYI